jgi:hypothetical protein
MTMINLLLSDKVVFPVFQILFLLVFVYAVLQELLTRNSGIMVTRGEEGWKNFEFAYGILAVIATLLISTTEALKGHKTIIALSDLGVLLYLVFYNSWFRNKLVGAISRSKTKHEHPV